MSAAMGRGPVLRSMARARPMSRSPLRGRHGFGQAGSFEQPAADREICDRKGTGGIPVRLAAHRQVDVGSAALGVSSANRPDSAAWATAPR